MTELPGGHHLPAVRGLRVPAGAAAPVRDTTATGYDPALVTTDTEAGPTAVIERYPARRIVGVAIEDAPGLGGRSGITPKLEGSGNLRESQFPR